MGRITDLLDSIDVAKENTDELYNIFRIVPDFGIPVLRFFLFKGATLIRQRVNLKGSDFFNVSDLRYPPASCIKGYERANFPYQPMFYACCFPGDSRTEEDPPPRVVALMETSSFYRDTEASGIERSTVSRWDVTADLELVAMPFTAEYSRACKLINDIKNGWNQEISKYDVNPDGLELIMYMASEIGKNFSVNVEYFKIANFVNYLLNINEKTRNVDGIIYPSVPGAGAGFNVAIKPESFQKKVEFVGASKCYLAKKKDKAYQIVVNHTASVQDGVITYEDNQIDPREYAVYSQYAEGNSFIN